VLLKAADILGLDLDQDSSLDSSEAWP
jgi:hypothetical protein